MFAGASSFLVDGWVGDRFDAVRVAGVGRPVAVSSSVFVCGSTPSPPYFAQSPPTMEVSRYFGVWSLTCPVAVGHFSGRGVDSFGGARKVG